jgi:hypothetical protein
MTRLCLSVWHSLAAFACYTKSYNTVLLDAILGSFGCGATWHLDVPLDHTVVS